MLSAFTAIHAERVIVMLRSDDGTTELLTTTVEHPFNVEGRGWVAAINLQAGDQLRAAWNKKLTLVSIRVKPEPLLAYNLAVADTHTYFVGNSTAWVHNACAIRGYKFGNMEKDAFTGKGVHINVTADGVRGKSVHVSFRVNEDGRVVAFITDKINEATKKRILDQVNRRLLTDKGFMRKLERQARHVEDAAKQHKKAGEYTEAEQVGEKAGRLADAIRSQFEE